MLDFAFMQSCVPMFAKALTLTLYIASFGISAAIVIGLVCAVVLYFKPPLLKSLIKAYVEVARNTPLLIQLFFLYYGLYGVIGINLNEYLCAIIGIAFLGGGYMCEAFRAGIESVGKAQIELGESIGLSRMQMIRYVVFPQSLPTALPQIGANVIFLLKETSVVGVIALADVMFATKDIITNYYKTYEALTMLVLAYLVVLLPLSLLFSALEAYYKRRVL